MNRNTGIPQNETPEPFYMTSWLRNLLIVLCFSNFTVCEAESDKEKIDWHHCEHVLTITNYEGNLDAIVQYGVAEGRVRYIVVTREQKHQALKLTVSRSWTGARLIGKDDADLVLPNITENSVEVSAGILKRRSIVQVTQAQLEEAIKAVMPFNLLAFEAHVKSAQEKLGK